MRYQGTLSGALTAELAWVAEGTTQTRLRIVIALHGFGTWGAVQCVWVQNMWTGNSCRVV